MTDRYNFEPILDDASPIPSRFVAPMDESGGGAWLSPCPEVCRRSVVVTLSLRDLSLILRPRRRGQRPAGTTKSAWFSLRRGERRQFGGVP